MRSRRRARISALSAFAAIAFAVAPAGVSAEAPSERTRGLDLRWEPLEDADCPPGSAVERRVWELVEITRPLVPVRAHARIERTEAGLYRMTLVVTSKLGEGRRLLEEATCAALTRAAIAVLAWALQPEMDTPSRPVTDEAATPVTPPIPPATPRVLRAVFDLEVVVDVGTLPAPAAGVRSRASMRVGEHLRVGGYGAYFPGARGFVEDAPSGLRAGGDFRLGLATLELCGLFWARRIALCAGPELAVLHGSGFGVRSPDVGRATFFAATGAAELAWPFLPIFAAFLRIEGVVPWGRERFALAGVGLVHRPERVSVRLGAGLRLEL